MKEKFFTKYAESLEAMSRAMAEHFQRGGRLFVMGNGGNMSTTHQNLACVTGQVLLLTSFGQVQTKEAPKILLTPTSQKVRVLFSRQSSRSHGSSAVATVDLGLLCRSIALKEGGPTLAPRFS
jgi:hypothetical protein